MTKTKGPGSSGKKVVSIKQPALEIEKALPASRFPPIVMEFAKLAGKTPSSYWFIDEGKTLCILWTDYSKDKFVLG